MADSRYLRYPSIREDLLTFVADDDVWLAPVSGGRAWRISADQAQAACPRISPDGSLVTWTSWRDGPPEIYLAGTGLGGTEEGGSARVSYWSSQTTRVRSWSPAGEIIATTAAEQPFSSRTWAYAIPVAEGAAQFSAYRRLPFGPVSDVAMDGSAVALLAGTTGREPALWKRYRGGTSGRLWLRESGPDEGLPFRRLLADLAGQFFSPMLIGGRLAFISDHEGTGNLYSCALDGAGLRRHTDHDGFYVRNASTDGGRVVYQCAGDLWLLADLSPDSLPERLEVSLGSPAAGRATRLVCADDDLDDLSCDQTGQASAVQVRGTVHWVTHRDGPARALSVIPGPVARLPRVLGATGQVVWVVEVDGVDALEVASASGDPLPGQLLPGQPLPGHSRRLAAGEIGWAGDLVASPDGRLAAVASRDGGVLVVDVESGEVTELARSDCGPVTGLAFAPDSAWLAWSEPGESPLRRLRLARLADRDVTDLTDGRFIDTEPVFTADGKYLAFLSRRTFDPVYDAHVFDLSFPYGSRPYLITLAAATPSPFGPLVGGRPVGSGKDDDHSADSAGPGSPARGPPARGRPARGRPARGRPAAMRAPSHALLTTSSRS